MTTGTVRTTYRIDRQQAEHVWKELPTIYEDHELAESEYEKFRELHPGTTFRLVMIHEHAERCGRGRVYL
jgi:hypothetical protein